MKTKIKFEWDRGNLKHVLYDHPERGNTKQEVESVFDDPNKLIEFDRFDPVRAEARFFVLGIGTRGILQYVVFVDRNGKIRPITCYPAGDKLQRLYYEKLSTASGKKGKTEASSGD